MAEKGIKRNEDVPMQKLQWILQRNLTKREVLDQIESALKIDNIDFQEVDVIPFSEELPAIRNDSAFSIFYGSTTLMLNAYNDPRFSKGVFYNYSFNMANYLKQWKERMLNNDALITTFEIFSKQDHDPLSEWFVRPNSDAKGFSGTIMTFERIKSFTKEIETFNNPHLTSNTLIAISSPKKIIKEWRSFVVDGNVISSTRYLQNDRLDISTEDVPHDLNGFIEDSYKLYFPHEIFVIDTALFNDNYYIVECNCFNGTGFYDHDIIEIIRAINNFLLKN